VAPNEIILIDDSRANLIAAEQAGWNVLWFDVYHSEQSATHIREALEPVTG
jgi:FMN phosphatase YigB (HAD superfamily)